MRALFDTCVEPAQGSSDDLVPMQDESILCILVLSLCGAQPRHHLEGPQGVPRCDHFLCQDPRESRGVLALVATIRQDPWESRGVLAVIVATIRKDPRESRGVPKSVFHS